MIHPRRRHHGRQSSSVPSSSSSSSTLLLAVVLGLAAVLAASSANGQAIVAPIHGGSAHRLRSRSTQDLQAWAARERLRMSSKYGPISEGAGGISSSTITTSTTAGDGLSPLKIRRRKLGSSSNGSGHDILPRQIGVEEASSPTNATRQTSRTATTSGTSITGRVSSRTTVASTAAPATTTALVTPSGIPTTSTLGYVNLTNYQADLYVVFASFGSSPWSHSIVRADFEPCVTACFGTYSEYYAPIQVGTPPQNFSVILDTGSSDFWLVDTNCTTEECLSVRKFAANATLTGQPIGQDFSVRYGQGTAAGTLWNDTITLAGHNFTNQTVALCDNVADALLGGDASGIMGLGFPSLSASRTTPYWLNLMQAAQASEVGLSAPLTPAVDFLGFSFYLTRFHDTTGNDTEFGGLFTLGTLSNSSYSGTINFVDIPPNSQSYWVIPMEGLSVNGTQLPDVGTPTVAIDTGTTLIGGPQEVVQSLYESIGEAWALEGAYEGYYTFPCDSNVNVSFTFGNQTYNMTAEDMNLGVFHDDQCLGAFFDLTLSSGSAAVISWVIGGAFLKNVYSVYRYSPGPSVGFAALSPALQAANAPRNSTSSSGDDGNSNNNNTAIILPSGVFGAPTPLGNASTISGSPLFTLASTVSQAAAKQDSLPSTRPGLAAAASRRMDMMPLTTMGTLGGIALLALSAWTLDVRI